MAGVGEWQHSEDVQMKILVNFVVTIVWAAIIICLGVSLYWMWEPVRPVITVERQQVLDVNRRPTQQFRMGDTVVVIRHLKIDRLVIHTRAWRVILRDSDNEAVVREELAPIPNPVGDFDRTYQRHLDGAFTPGKYVWRVYTTYKINHFKDGTYEVGPPIKFEVVR